MQRVYSLPASIYIRALISRRRFCTAERDFYVADYANVIDSDTEDRIIART
jgi:hypothetical protein